MHYSTFLTLTSAASLIAAAPFTPRAVSKVPAGTIWDIIINNDQNLPISTLKAAPGSVIDIDLFDTSADDIAELKKTKTVICYFSAGTREDWRDDHTTFKSKTTATP
jgi:hypothetical protein